MVSSEPVMVARIFAAENTSTKDTASFSRAVCDIAGSSTLRRMKKTNNAGSAPIPNITRQATSGAKFGITRMPSSGGSR